MTSRFLALSILFQGLFASVQTIHLANQWHDREWVIQRNLGSIECTCLSPAPVTGFRRCGEKRSVSCPPCAASPQAYPVRARQCGTIWWAATCGQWGYMTTAICYWERDDDVQKSQRRGGGSECYSRCSGPDRDLVFQRGASQREKERTLFLFDTQKIKV